ncbi:hypothetical protein KIW84_023128 [Lathyrus oleraceus]|uniref:Reverse transcriptase RNase H-like domain-containing protein n=1 Tax=Pisum sativum TaxID=3888 RepID=A0A9D4YC65_PEA|nr:hypothetical protein KIW84_023128 [Pisum sativum]
MQEKRPIALFSEALGGKNLAKSAYERELMAVALAIQHWRPYLIGRHFTVTTDQKSLKQLWQQKITTPGQQNWATKLLGYQFDIVYKPGVENRGADALSCLPENGELMAAVSYPVWDEGNVIQEEVHNDKVLLKIIEEFLIPKMLAEFHSTPVGGHSGFYRTYRRLAANVYWIGMKAKPKSWVLRVPWAEFWFNTTFHASAGSTPFELVYGRKPPMITRLLQGETRVEAVQKELEERDEAIRQLKAHLQRAQDRMKHYADEKRTDRNFRVGEWVFLKLRPHRQKSVVSRINAKLAARYYGPFQIVERIGAVAYKLKLPEGSRVHPVFHVSLLKKAIGEYQVESELPQGMEGDCADQFIPEDVLSTRMSGPEGQKMGQGWKCQITVGLVKPRLGWFILEGEEHQISRDWI